MISTQFSFGWRMPAIVALIAAATYSAYDAKAALVLVDVDARDEYPITAPVITSLLPTAEGVPIDANSRGVRSNRIMAQTFRATDKFSVESIFVGYRWNDANPAPTTFRLLEIPDVGAIYNPATATVLAGPTPVSVGLEPTPNQIGHYYALKFDWDASLSAGQPLILGPRTGQEGYALEFVGGTTTSPIAILFRDNTNVYPPGRAMEQFNNVPQGVQEIDDWVIAITGQLVPEPNALTIVLLALASTAGRRNRRNI